MKKCKNICVKHISRSEVKTQTEQIDGDSKDVVPIPNTKEAHKVIVVAPFVIDIQKHADSLATRHHFRKDAVFDTEHERREDTSDEGSTNLNLKWVVVKYLVSNQKHTSSKRFVGQVIGSQGNTVTVKFLKKAEFGKYIWPDMDDIDHI